MGPTEFEYLHWCHWISYLSFWKHPFLVSYFHHPNSIFWVLIDGNKGWKPCQTRIFLWDPRVLRTQLWKLSDMIQKHPHLNKLSDSRVNIYARRHGMEWIFFFILIFYMGFFFWIVKFGHTGYSINLNFSTWFGVGFGPWASIFWVITH